MPLQAWGLAADGVCWGDLWIPRTSFWCCCEVGEEAKERNGEGRGSQKGRRE